MKHFILTMVMAAFSVMGLAQTDTLSISVDEVVENNVTLNIFYGVDTTTYDGDSVYVNLGLYPDSLFTDALEVFGDSLDVLGDSVSHTFEYVLLDSTDYWALGNLMSSNMDTLYTDTLHFTALCSIIDTTMSISNIINKDKYLVEVYDLTGRVVYSCGQNRVKYGQEFNVFRQKGVFIYRYDDGTTEKRYIWVN